MKNLIKVLGIIAMLAVIGLVSCEVDEEEQVKITVTGIPEAANGKYAYIRLFQSDGQGEPVAYPEKNDQISGGKVTANMLSDDGKNFGKEGKYVISLYIHDAPITNDNVGSVKKFRTGGGKDITKGENIRAATDFAQETTGLSMTDVFASSKTPEEIAEEKVASFKGTYKAEYKATSTATADDTIETIDLTDVKKFKISDAKVSAPTTVVDSLEFQIGSWAESTTPPDYAANYPNAFKFTGKILSSTSGYYGTNSQTGKGIVQADINTTTCWMYIYISSDGKKMIRTPFSKDAANENKNVVLYYTDPANAPLREYDKQ